LSIGLEFCVRALDGDDAAMLMRQKIQSNMEGGGGVVFRDSISVCIAVYVASSTLLA
jgi:hypothetical protein